MGLIQAQGGSTQINIRAVNTDAKVAARVLTGGGVVKYDGDASIDGVPNTAAPVELNFMEVAGSSTGAFLPTKHMIDSFDGIEVTCMDVAMPMVIARVADFGLTGYETVAELDANKDFFARMEAIRIKAGAAMGMGDVSSSVTPKFGILAPAQSGGTVATRYFMPWNTHPTKAVTGSQCMASCVLTPGTVADGMYPKIEHGPVTITLEHPTGKMDVIIDFERKGGAFIQKSAGLVRTCRKLAQGHVFIPQSIWKGAQ